MIKNVASQKVTVFAWDSGAGVPKTGDQNNITAQISLNGAASAASNDVNPDQLDATNHPGIYIFNLLQAETNADMVIITPKSTTLGVVFKPVVAYPTTLTPTKSGYLDAAITSRSTLTAQQVWEYATRTLSSFGTLAADLWTNATRSLTDKAGFTISGSKTKLDDLHDATQGTTKDELDAAQLAIVNAMPDISDLALEAGIEDHVAAALTAYDPPTRAEAIDDKQAVLDALASAGITVADILAGDLADSKTFPAGSLGDRIRKLFWVLCNRLVITDATGAFTAYKGDGATPAATGNIVDNGIITTRGNPTWL